MVVYGAHGRRILAADPEGNALHECEWFVDVDGAAQLRRARVRLDWGQWVGLKPGGLVNSTVLDLSRKTRWQRLKADDLRQMAAHALGVSLDDVRFFYNDDDVTIDVNGHATIRHRKDAFYILDDAGAFAHPRFMACMGAMHWGRIDFLPVVELFQSLLPGTGSSVFELIRGLYDDQNQDPATPLPLRYRGIPTYPSEAAFRLFSGYFVPQVSGGRLPFDVFMNPSSSAEVIWLPSPTPPRRYFDLNRHLCVTVKGRAVQKVTVADDPTGLPYQAVGAGSADRSVSVTKEALVLTDGQTTRAVPIHMSWGSLEESPEIPSRPSSSWKQLFVGSLPVVDPREAFSAILLYPDGDSEIDEASSQPFVADYLEDLIEESSTLSALRGRARHALIENFDGALQSCLCSRTMKQTVLYTRPALAQRQAQIIWNNAAGSHRLSELAGIRFMAAADRHLIDQATYDWIYRWISFASFTEPAHLAGAVADLRHALTSDGHAFLVGPPSLTEPIMSHGLHILSHELVETLPPFHMHRNILPRARLKPGLTLFHVRRDR